MSLCKFPKQIQPVQTNPFKLCKIKRKKFISGYPARKHRVDLNLTQSPCIIKVV